MCIKIDQNSKEKVKELQKQPTIKGYSIKFIKDDQVTSLCYNYEPWKIGENRSTALDYPSGFEQRGFHFCFTQDDLLAYLQTLNSGTAIGDLSTYVIIAYVIIEAVVKTRDILYTGIVANSDYCLNGKPCFTASKCHWNGSWL